MPQAERAVMAMTMNPPSNSIGANSGTNLNLASFQHRLGALFLDAALFLVTLGIGWIIWSLIVWGEGQTPAKKILRIRVYAAETQRPATWGHMAIRELLIYLSLGIAAGLLDLITFGILGTLGLIAWYVLEIVFYFTKDKRTLRDLLVKTLIINES
jgi:uncharacterized RDD family membrane protein YckC